MPASVTPTYLLKGAAYALEQCGLLLRDANVLYRNGSYSSAVALALFAREELGRYRILLDLRKEVLGGKHLTIEAIGKRCKKHEHKQEAGMLSFVMMIETDNPLGGVLGTYLNVEHGSKEWRTARQQLEQAQQTIPVKRHNQRMSALYVDAVAPDAWSRPTKEISQLSAYQNLQDAANDYSGQYNNTLEAWIGHPTLPRPERPKRPELPPWLTAKFPP